jgi:hypothetical protein
MGKDAVFYLSSTFHFRTGGKTPEKHQGKNRIPPKRQTGTEGVKNLRGTLIIESSPYYEAG